MDSVSTSTHGDHVQQSGRNRRQRKGTACNPCRSKKIKSEGALTRCTACERHDRICTRLPRSRAKTARDTDTQDPLTATVRKLYAMVRNQTPWALGDPKLDDCGQPSIHDIAFKLGCLRSSGYHEPPIVPEDHSGLNKLARQPDGQPQTDATTHTPLSPRLASEVPSLPQPLLSPTLPFDLETTEWCQRWSGSRRTGYPALGLLDSARPLFPAANADFDYDGLPLGASTVDVCSAFHFCF
ncbi:hypothetical protein N658DRAFT_500099 [Parathielavia hyrcaniae]|uniref:Zn(2)-C6 fungal-type domain-containing protein n=1 Tax=Parathielavia hyrcaniae TaxID=113614 RepID=A0AAN6PU34_9PEZI|nr:hypothetical protein N658DRAFT_500099 [Parathielavia hyrcaniae]